MNDGRNAAVGQPEWARWVTTLRPDTKARDIPRDRFLDAWYGVIVDINTRELNLWSQYARLFSVLHLQLPAGRAASLETYRSVSAPLRQHGNVRLLTRDGPQRNPVLPAAEYEGEVASLRNLARGVRSALGRARVMDYDVTGIVVSGTLKTRIPNADAVTGRLAVGTGPAGALCGRSEALSDSGWISSSWTGLPGQAPVGDAVIALLTHAAARWQVHSPNNSSAARTME